MTVDKPAGLVTKLGQYELLKELPGGGVGATWIARSVLLAGSDDAPLFALLRLPRHLAKKTEAIETFTAEVKVAEDFKHPNVVGLIEVGNQEGEVYSVSEHFDGETLTGLIAGAGADGVPAPVVLRIIADVLIALDAAHTREPSLPHGELSPQYVLVGEDGITRVVGLGSARALSRVAPPLGARNHDRLAYAAPERVKTLSSPTGTPPTPTADVFSVAVMLWEALAKQRLFTSKIEAAIIQKVLTAPITSLATVPGLTVEASLAAAVTRALDRDPARRLGSASELLAEIDGLPAGMVATPEQVAAEVERISGKTLATRKTDVRAELARRAKKSGGSIPPPAAGRPTPMGAPRKPTLLGISAVKAAATAAGAAGMVGSRKLTPPAFAALPPPPPLETTNPTSSEAPTVPRKPPEPETDPMGEVAIPKAPPIGRMPAVSVNLEEIEEEVSAVVVAPAPPPAAPPPAPPLRRPASATLMMGSVQPAPPKPQVETKPEAKADPKAEAKPEPEAETKIEAKIEAKVDAPRAKPPSPAKAATPTPPQPAQKTPAPVDGHASTTPTTGGRGKTAAAVEKIGPASTLGRYEILMPVARGGMASVWAAKLPGSRGFQKIFAIKTMLPDVSDDPEFESMFLDEARVAARIRHPNVVEIIDLGEQDDILYLVMEWVDGDNLGMLVKAARAHGGVPLPIVVRIASQVCAGLHAAHELRDDDGHLVDLVHRDISPANVLVSSSGFVKIVDFGIAKSKGRLHITRVGGMVKGKTPYLSPEQLGQQPIDRRSDIFSFGVLLYVLTTGLHPFRGETDSKTIENIALREPVPLRALSATIPEEFEALVLKALSKDPADRFSTAAEMQRALEQVAGSLGEGTTEEDIAAFVRKVLSEAIAKRGADLKAAIEKADAGRLAEVSQPSRALVESISKPGARVELELDPPKSVAPPPAADTSSSEPAATESTESAKDDANVAVEGDSDASAVAAELGRAPETPEPANDPLTVDPAASEESSARPVTRPGDEGSDLLDEAPAPARKPGVVIAVAVVLAACLGLGGLALFSGGSKDPRTSSGTVANTGAPPPTAATVAATVAPTATEPAPAATPTATDTASPAPSATDTAVATATATTPTATAATPPPSRTQGTGKSTSPTKSGTGGKGKTKKPYNPGGI